MFAELVTTLLQKLKEDEAVLWENLVALQLLKYCYDLEYSEGEKMSLFLILSGVKIAISSVTYKLPRA